MQIVIDFIPCDEKFPLEIDWDQLDSCQSCLWEVCFWKQQQTLYSTMHMNTLWLCSHHILVDLIIIKNILATPLGWSIRVLQKICWHKWHVKGYISCHELSSCIVSHNQTTKPAPPFSSSPFLGRGFIECFCLYYSFFSTLFSPFESHFVREQWVALLVVHHEVLAVYFFQHVQTFVVPLADNHDNRAYFLCQMPPLFPPPALPI